MDGAAAPAAVSARGDAARAALYIEHATAGPAAGPPFLAPTGIPKPDGRIARTRVIGISRFDYRTHTVENTCTGTGCFVVTASTTFAARYRLDFDFRGTTDDAVETGRKRRTRSRVDNAL